MKTITSREEWGAVPPKSEKPLRLPVEILIMTDTLSEECNEPEECKKIVKELQRVYMEEKGFDDIPWSFMIGGDGNVYEGRGWKIQPFKTDLTNKTQKNYDGLSLDIAYIGNFQKKYASLKMQVAFGGLDVYAIDKDYVTFIHDVKCLVKRKSSKDDYSKNPWGKYPSNKAYDAVDRLLKYLDWKKVLDMLECDMIDFTIDYDALDVH